MYTKTFLQLSKKDVAIAGGKGASLGEMMQAGILVPSGFVILASAFEKFLEETDLAQEITAILKKINYKDVNSVDKASNVIYDLIRDMEMPKDLQKEFKEEFRKLKSYYVAVRSSATAEDSNIASWAGELESYLNTDKNNLLVNIKNCWSSLFTPRAIFYRKEKKLLETHVGVAVVVQKMIQSDISGICFTVHPVTEDCNQIVIEAGWGLGEAIVGGLITPDSFVIDKKDGKIIDKNISRQKTMIVREKNETKKIAVARAKQEKQKLAEKEILKLAKICQKIESHYGFPCDIEWVYENGKFYIIQSRPITTLKNNNIISLKDDRVISGNILKGIMAAKGRAVGRARIILSLGNLNQMKKNEILVTSMTTPDYLMAMKKAAAFITDEGGITCHAAIIAREIQKPCIVGTEIATQFFKDGDLIEVDANKGIAKILKRK